MKTRPKVRHARRTAARAPGQVTRAAGAEPASPREFVVEHSAVAGELGDRLEIELRPRDGRSPWGSAEVSGDPLADLIRRALVAAMQSPVRERVLKMVKFLVEMND